MGSRASARITGKVRPLLIGVHVGQDPSPSAKRRDPEAQAPSFFTDLLRHEPGQSLSGQCLGDSADDCCFADTGHAGQQEFRPGSHPLIVKSGGHDCVCSPARGSYFESLRSSKRTPGGKQIVKPPEDESGNKTIDQAIESADDHFAQ